MPDFGRLTPSALPHTTPISAPPYPPPPWDLENARILQVSFEIEKEASLAWLPPSLTRAIPPYGHLWVAHYSQSPVGPFSLAALCNVCRHTVRARAFTLIAAVDRVEALMALREVWAFPAGPGQITLEKEDSRLTARIARPNGQTLVELEVGPLEEIEPGQIRYDPFLNLRLVPSSQEGKPPLVLELLQVDPEYHLKAAWRGWPKVHFSETALQEGWGVFRPLNFIAATYSVCDTSLPFARYIVEFEPQPR